MYLVGKVGVNGQNHAQNHVVEEKNQEKGVAKKIVLVQAAPVHFLKVENATSKTVVSLLVLS